jgi:hypothetical protein
LRIPVKRVAYTLVLIALMAAYVYLGLTRGFSYILSIAFITLMLIFANLASRLGMIRFPPGVQIPFVTVAPRIGSFIKGLLCFPLIAVWVFAAGYLSTRAGLDDSWFGVALVFGPALVLSVLAGLYFAEAVGFGKKK